MLADGRFQNQVTSNWYEVVWNFTRSELESSLGWKSVARQIGPSLASKVRVATCPELTQMEWDTLELALLEHRGDLGTALKAIEARWFLSDLTIGEVPRLKILAIEKFRAIAKTLVLEDFVSAVESGIQVPDSDWHDGFRWLRPRFAMKLMLGRPILVVEAPGRPIWIADGLTRLACIASKLKARELGPTHVPVLVGHTSHLERYPFALNEGS